MAGGQPAEENPAAKPSLTRLSGHILYIDCRTWRRRFVDEKPTYCFTAASASFVSAGFAQPLSARSVAASMDGRPFFWLCLPSFCLHGLKKSVEKQLCLVLQMSPLGLHAQ
ncbi:MAG: hypothetical protein KFF68_03800 [Desulfosarcina sp.]|nr:hypothetical protein [Desulfosarcina sp.]